MSSNTLSVFDFDGTIVSKDTGYEFYKWAIKKSLLRTSVFFLLAPLIAVFLAIPAARKTGINIACYIGTAFQTNTLYLLKNQFTKCYFSNLKAKVYKDAIREIEACQSKGHAVLILSGCPQWLLKDVVKKIGIKNCYVLGSSYQIYHGAILLQEHCYSSNKLNVASRNGFDDYNWENGYSDSAADIPMLKNCENKFLINVQESKKARFKQALSQPIHYQTWA